MSVRTIKILMALVVLLTAFFYWQSSEQPKYLQVSFLDVGQGDATLLRTPQGQNILVDGGPDNNLLYQVASQLPWWEREIDYLVITHWDDDHFVGSVELFKKYQVKHVLVSYLPDTKNPNYLAWQEAAKQEGVTPVLASVGETIKIGDLQGLVVSANSNPDLPSNDRSLVVRWSYGQIDFLLTGDLPVEQEQYLLKNSLPLAAEILKVSHHGSKYSSSQAFLDVVRPELCVIEVGEKNKFGHPSPEAVARLNQAGCSIKMTKDLGNIRIESDGQKWWLK